MLAAHANSGKNDSGTHSIALQSCLTAKDIFVDVDRVLIARLCKKSIIFGSTPFDHVAVVLSNHHFVQETVFRPPSSVSINITSEL
jgi:hypothetical protein